MDFISPETWDASVYLMTLLPVRGGSAFLAQTEELDWIRAAGHTAVCMTPVFQCVPEYQRHYDPDVRKIVDHREINPDLGTMEEFLRLVKGIHQRGMKVILEVVMDALVRDSPLFREHPEYFRFCGDCGDPGLNEPIPLNYDNPDLRDYQSETLRMWAQYVDGFRCTAAPRVPMAFWKQVRETVSHEKPDFIWMLVEEEQSETLADYF